MFTSKRFITISLIALLASSASQAQIPARQTSGRQPVQSAVQDVQDVQIIIQSEQVRFTARSNIAEMQLQVFDKTGELVFDSGLSGANEINWLLQTASGDSLKSGLYAYTLSIKENGAAEARVRRGHFIVDRVKDRDGKTDKLWVTSQSEDGIGTELTVAWNEDGAIAGTKAGAKTANAGLLADEIPEGQVVKTLNGLTDNVTLEAGTNVAITPEGNNLKIDAQVGDGQVVKGLNGLTDQVTLEAGPNITITPNGNTLTISATGAGNSSITEMNGNVGIGTGEESPVSKLDVRGWLTLDSGSSPVLFTAANGGEQNRFLQLINSPAYRSASGLKAGGVLVADDYNFAQPGKNNLIVKGGVGIGTPTPIGELHVAGYGPFITLESRQNGVNRLTHIQNANGTLVFKPTGFGSCCAAVVMEANTGNVGIGTSTPAVKLHVAGTGLAVESSVQNTNGRAILSLNSTINGQNRVWTLENGIFGEAGNFAIYDRTAIKARLKIDTTGLVSVDSLKINGADFAENFDVNVADTTGEATMAKVEAGLVVSIDPVNPGKLQLSAQAYDRRVAGIISGAGGIKPGMMMSQEGTMADGKYPVALSGRVYCWVDASQGAVEPGDLLTTSATPGHAMKVVDSAKAQGAVIGKAMTGLKEGKGLVLVLVTLQ
ncbi:MAG TPA: hypothetical protein VJ810_13175 [Blastocatellia bacterium]|nr:hypothetical protein [Blastocatellia bacterium]